MTRLSRLLATWGNGQHGRLGHGPGTGSELFPRVVTALAGSNVLQVACGGAHTAVVTGGHHADT
jgi:alpha-tubulin suppressor-like RCC1 family protein